MCPIPPPKPVDPPYSLDLTNDSGIVNAHFEVMDPDIGDNLSGGLITFTKVVSKRGLWVVHEEKDYNMANPDGKINLL